MSFPVTRMRRFRRTESLRRMTRETRLHPDDLVLPLFTVEGSGVREAIGSMPGVFRHSVDQLAVLVVGEFDVLCLAERFEGAVAALRLAVRDARTDEVPQTNDDQEHSEESERPLQHCKTLHDNPFRVVLESS